MADQFNSVGRQREKIYIASISAIAFDPRVVPEQIERGMFLCRLREDVHSAEEMLVVLAHHPLLFLGKTEAAAREAAMRTAKAYLPEDEGFTNHVVTLREIPTSCFIEAQVFMTLREFFRWLLHLTGFSRT